MTYPCMCYAVSSAYHIIYKMLDCVYSTVVDVLGYVYTLPDVEQWVGWLDISKFPLPLLLVHETK